MTKRAWFLTMLAGAALAAPAMGQKAAAPPTAAWLDGAWVGRGDFCAGDVAYRFKRDGSYGGPGTEGRWALKGHIMTLTSWEVDFETGRKRGREARETIIVSRLGLNAMRYGREERRRCPTRNGVEPWHPKVPLIF